MIVVLAIVFLIMPMAVEYICDKAAKRGRGPLAEPARPSVIDGLIVPPPITAPDLPELTVDEPMFTDPRDAEQCATESRLTRELLDGTLAPPLYRAEMAALAAGAASSQLPGDPGGRPV